MGLGLCCVWLQRQLLMISSTILSTSSSTAASCTALLTVLPRQSLKEGDHALADVGVQPLELAQHVTQVGQAIFLRFSFFASEIVKKATKMVRFCIKQREFSVFRGNLFVVRPQHIDHYLHC